jgi:hypothetical protein
VDDDLRCSVQARDAGLRPGGTAAAHDAFLLVEVPLPWPRAIEDHPVLAGLEPPPGTRVQGVVPAPDHVAEGEAAVVLHRHPPGPFRRYEREERRVPLNDVVPASRALLAGEQHADGQTSPGTIDLLVCTHGTRDRCCGSLGTALFLTVASRPDLRVRRTSHTGGHRFAPTAVLLPEGTCWGWLDDDLLAAVLDRSRPPADLLGHYRGSTAMGGPATQVAEAAVFAEVGWSWVDEARSAEVVEAAGDRTVVRVDSTAGAWDVVVRDLGDAPQPVCGEAPGSGPKSDPQLAVVELLAAR